MADWTKDDIRRRRREDRREERRMTMEALIAARDAFYWGVGVWALSTIFDVALGLTAWALWRHIQRRERRRERRIGGHDGG